MSRAGERAGFIATAPALRTWADAALRAVGLSCEDAGLVAGHLVQTSLWGIDTHGIARLPHYLQRLSIGSIEAKPRIRVRQTAAATASLDGGHGLGMVVCSRAMDEASRLAREAGVGMVGCYNSSHCGAIGLYGRQAARAGLIGIAFTHASAVVVPHQGRHAFLGTNPLCITVPCADAEPVCLDMATTWIPFNRVMNARRDGEDLPPDVAVDSDGHATTDAQAATALLPLAGHKGYAAAFMIDILCGLLNGAPYGPHIPPMYQGLDARRRLGSLMVAVDPSRFAGGPALAEQVLAMAREARAQPAAAPGAEVLVPGDPEYRCAQRREAEGIPVEPGLAEQLQAWSKRLRVAGPDLS